MQIATTAIYFITYIDCCSSTDPRHTTGNNKEEKSDFRSNICHAFVQVTEIYCNNTLFSAAIFPEILFIFYLLNPNSRAFFLFLFFFNYFLSAHCPWEVFF